MTSFLRKLKNHIWNGTLISRIRDHKQISIEKKWIKFYDQSNNPYIIKKHSYGFKLKLKRNNLLTRAIFLEQYEENELQYVNNVLQKGDIFFDIGANFGLYSIMASNLVGSKGKIYSFEPTKDAFYQLKENISLNGYSNIFAMNVAVSDTDEKRDLFLNSEDNNALNTLVGSSNSTFREEVKCVILDDFIKKNKLNGKIKLIKIDVEGWELRVLKGIEHEIQMNHPVLLIEFNDNNFDKAGFSSQDIISFLENLKYGFFEVEFNGNLIPLKKKKHYTYCNLVSKYVEG